MTFLARRKRPGDIEDGCIAVLEGPVIPAHRPEIASSAADQAPSRHSAQVVPARNHSTIDQGLPNPGPRRSGVTTPDSEAAAENPRQCI